MRYKPLAGCIIAYILLAAIGLPQPAKANEQPAILILYTTADGNPNEKVLFWEGTFSSFARLIHTLEVEAIDEKAIYDYDVVIFFVDERKQIPSPLRRAFYDYEGIIIAFGENADQLPAFQQWTFLGNDSLRTVEKKSLPKVEPVVHIELPDGATKWATGYTLDDRLPLIVQKGKHAYIATTALNKPIIATVSKTLHSLLHMDEPIAHPAYIRFDDISPISNPQKVKEAGEYMLDRNIPLYLSVTTMYVDRNTKTQIHLSENKELVRVLRYLQSRGGIIIAHGYDHTYYADETETGFEFWDVRLNQKVTTNQPEAIPSKLHSPAAYPSAALYEQYINEINEIEKAYIELKHTKAIEQLVDLQLYPLSFKVPNDAMSANGYEVTSAYFSSLFGKVQWSDDDWQVSYTPLFISQPALLAGMTLYPETIGFIDTAFADPIIQLEKHINQIKDVPGAVIGGSFHPYIDFEYLPQMIQAIEKVGNVQWIDIRDDAPVVQTELVSITQKKGEPPKVQSAITIVDRLIQRVKERPFESFLWLIVTVVLLFVLAFFIYISRLRIRLKKRLFEERKQS